jgi:hypothetical protein
MDTLYCRTTFRLRGIPLPLLMPVRLSASSGSSYLFVICGFFYKYNISVLNYLKFHILNVLWLNLEALFSYLMFTVVQNPAGGHGFLSVVSVVCCQVEVSATG